MIFDAHTHYDDEAFDEDREELLAGLPAAGIAGVVNIATNKESIATTQALADRYDFVWEAVGFHPDDASQMEAEEETILPWLRTQLARPKAVAIGEIGLDYHWDNSPRKIQQKWFYRQLVLAREQDIPVVVHTRDAAQDTRDILQAAGGAALSVVLHCYPYSVEMAREFLNLGYYLGVGGVVTFKNGRKLKEVVSYMPLDRILVETDCPYMSPAPYRGKRNDSTRLPLVLDAIAQIKGLDRGLVEETCYENARRFYRL